MHNVSNAAAAAAVALYLSVPADLIREGLVKFAGVGRRFDIKGVVNDITVIDDYGHHPVEIRATLEAARGCKFNRLLVLFSPIATPAPSTFGMNSARVQSSGYSRADRYLCGQRSAHPGRGRVKRLRAPFARPVTRTSTIFVRCRKASSTC